MAYNFNKGNTFATEIVSQDDSNRDTKIDLGNNQIDFIISGVKVASIISSSFSASLLLGNGSQLSDVVSNGTSSLDPTLQAIANITSSADTYIYFTGIDTVATGTITSFARTILDDANAATALSTLGAQAFDSTLNTIANLTTAADRYIYFTGQDVAATGTITSFGRSLVDDADSSTARTTLGLTIGTNVQAYDATLATIANLTTAADRYVYFTGVDTAATGTITTFGRSLIDDTSNANARTTLGLGDIATQNSGTVSLVGGTINNIPIGNTTQSSGRFSTLSASSTLEIGGDATFANNATVSNTLYCYNDIIASGTTATINVIRSSSLNHPLMSIENRNIAGDAALRFESGPDGTTSDSDSYIIGIDGSDGQKFKISWSGSKGDGGTGALLGSNDIMTLNGNISVTVTPATLFENNITVSKNTILGISITDKVTANAGFTTIEPHNAAESLGASSNRWSNLHHLSTFWYDSSDRVWKTQMSASDLHFYYGTNLLPTTSSKGFLDSATSVSNIDFTGQHRNVLAATEQLSDYKNYVGLIVVSNGNYKNSDLSTKPSINESLPTITLSTQRNQKSVWGVVSDSEEVEDTTRKFAIGIFVSVLEKQQTTEDTRIIVNSIGEGGVWVCNINGNLQNGDYITTCEVPGYGMKQDSEFLANYTVAKITQDCTFDLNNPNYDCIEFDFNGTTYRKAFVGCTYHCG